ncbi:TPA: helix-turn-helix transcriptional regulator [Enterococcus faecalis]|uniref:helix-turn-helix domain-containing protein n=1 Tax=unclassified Enterococcus TaxID=2608891 RepID=UPI0029747A77|nr:helix-turn-helix transcriptional regulator [Enterococcus faecalis]HAP2781574.1 helix-turn-helix transcriptional regulator [Enterococcus faecalis]
MDKTTENQLIKKRITHFLHQKEITENRLAQLSGITQSTLNGIMNKGRVPRIDTIHALCNGLNISVRDFFDFEPYNLTNENKNDSKEELMIYLKQLSAEINKIEKKLEKR